MVAITTLGRISPAMTRPLSPIATIYPTRWKLGAAESGHPGGTRDRRDSRAIRRSSYPSRLSRAVTLEEPSDPVRRELNTGDCETGPDPVPRRRDPAVPRHTRDVSLRVSRSGE